MGSHPRPHFFISRPDHSITPLIAVDELPDYVRINGVPAIMTQADTQAMMSLGVKERSLGQYEVQVVELSRSSSREGPAKSSDTSCSGRPSNSFDEARPLASTAKQSKQTENHTADSSSIEIIQRPDLEAGRETAAAVNKAAHDGVKDKRSVDIEGWRQDIEVVETVDDIQVIPNGQMTQPKEANTARLGLIISLLPIHRLMRRSKRAWAMRTLVLLRQKLGLLQEKRSIALTGFAPVNATSPNKDVCTSTKCLMMTPSRLSASVLFLLGTL